MIEDKDDSDIEKTADPHEKVCDAALYSDKEIKMIVKDFIAAYISGQIQVSFPNATEYTNIAKASNEKIDFKEARDREDKGKRLFRNQISRCIGEEKVTAESQTAATKSLFLTIVALRNGERITGVFTEYALESRIRQLEEGQEKANTLIQEIVDWIYRGVVDK